MSDTDDRLELILYDVRFDNTSVKVAKNKIKALFDHGACKDCKRYSAEFRHCITMRSFIGFDDKQSCSEFEPKEQK